MNEKIEQWRPVVGWESFYEVSDYGRIRSLKRDTRNSEKILKGERMKKGYIRIRLLTHSRSVRILLHRIVGAAFIPNPQRFPQINHKDGLKHNNSAENLEWVTQSMNSFHALRTGLFSSPVGQHCGASKLTNKDVDNILSSPMNGAQIAKLLGVARCTVNRIRSGKTWDTRRVNKALQAAGTKETA